MAGNNPVRRAALVVHPQVVRRPPGELGQNVAETMSTSNPNWPPMLFIMEVLMATVDDLSSRLQRIAVSTPQMSLISHPERIFTSNDYDVAVSPSAAGISIDIAEPNCGKPIIASTAPTDDIHLRDAHRLIHAIDARRATLTRVMSGLRAHLASFPDVTHTCSILELARSCDLHATTVSRALDNKVCLTPSGPIRCRRYISERQ